MSARKNPPVADKAIAPDAPMLALIEVPGKDAPTVIDQARVILLDAQKFDQFYDKVKGETDAFEPDVSTAAGRDKVKSMAFRVTRTHTALDKAALELTAAWREQTNTVNASRKTMVERLKALADEVRRPLTEWEEAEDARVLANADTVRRIRDDGAVQFDDTAESVATRGRAVWALTFDPPQWTPEEAEQAEAAKHATVNALVAVRDRLEKEEAERAELAALRAEKEARDLRQAEEREAQAERDRVESERVEAEAAAERERQRLADAAQAEKDRIAAAELAAADKAREDAERAAQEAREATQRAHDEAIAAERKRADDAERERQVEADRIAEEQRKREAQAIADAAAAKKLADEQAEREKNKAHRARVKTAAKLAIMTCGADEETAQKIVLAIIAGEVPAVAMDFRS